MKLKTVPWIGVLRIAVLAFVLIQVYMHAHWSVAVMLTGLAIANELNAYNAQLQRDIKRINASIDQSIDSIAEKRGWDNPLVQRLKKDIHKL